MNSSRESSVSTTRTRNNSRSRNVLFAPRAQAFDHSSDLHMNSGLDPLNNVQRALLYCTMYSMFVLALVRRDGTLWYYYTALVPRRLLSHLTTVLPTCRG